MTEIARGIVVDPGICFRVPVVKGPRVHVTPVPGHWAAGDGPEDIADGYGLTREQVLDCLSFAHDRVFAAPGGKTAAFCRIALERLTCREAAPLPPREIFSFQSLPEV